MTELELRQQIVATGRALVEKGLVTGTGGNISARTERGFLITPSGMDYFSLTADDLVELDFSCAVLSGARKPSIEKALHAAVLAARPDVHAVIHTHSAYSTAVAACRKPLPPVTDNQVAAFGGTVPLAAYAPIGTEELAKNAAQAMGDGCAVLLANHGAVCAGATLAQTLARCEMLEACAQVYLLGKLAGGCVALDEDDVRAEYEDLKTRHGQ